MKPPKESPPNNHRESISPVRSMLLQSALLRGAGALVLCGALTAVLLWATQPMA